MIDLPGPAERRIALRVTPAAERALRGGHPWLFEQAIQRQSHAGAAGDLAVIFDRKGRFLAVGLYDPAAPIRVRILQSGQPATIDRNWFGEKLRAAAKQRESLTRTRTTGYRLVHGENDGLPGLVIDRYAGALVIKLYSAAWIPHLSDLLPALAAVQPSERQVLRLSRSLQQNSQLPPGLQDGIVLVGPDLTGPVVFQENGLFFEADLLRGQKTGFFLDQRENRARVEGLAAGCRVLNVFAYSGGFSLYAARGGARSVLSLDLSDEALAAAARNFELNRADPAIAAARHELLTADAFEALARLAQQGRRFDLVIIDPPAFAHKQAQVERALAAYGKLTRLGLAVLERGGVLVQASCSSRVDPESFFSAIREAVRPAGRLLQEIERSGHPLDHPIGFPEGAYLKCLFARLI